jgi:hypothetical protein
MTSKSSLSTSIPPSPAEAAAADPRWERRGILGRLVHLDHGVAMAQRRQAEGPSRGLSGEDPSNDHF